MQMQAKVQQDTDRARQERERYRINVYALNAMFQRSEQAQAKALMQDVCDSHYRPGV